MKGKNPHGKSSQLDSLKIHWVELRSSYGYRKIEDILKVLNIPYTKFNENNLDMSLTTIFSEIFDLQNE